MNQTFSREKIAQRIEELAQEIRRDCGDGPVFLLGILNGSAVFLSDLLRALPGEVSYEFIKVFSEPADTDIADALEIDFLTHFSIADKNVYLLKDVVSTGIIENYLLMQLRQKSPAKLKLVALLDRPDLRTVDVTTDFRLFEVAQGHFAGYGLTVQGRHGNLPYIGTL